MCIIYECNTRPIYNKLGESKGLYCFKHKLDGMFDVVSKKCLYHGCMTQPKYNIIGENKGLYCAKHKLNKMVDVISKTCIHNGCNTQPYYNKIGEKKALYCIKHKLIGMIDIKNKNCIYKDCKTRANYNIKGDYNALYCVKHKLDNMVDVKNKICIYNGCETQPIYNVEGESNALYCVKHKKSGMIDVKNKTCKNIWCYTQVNHKYNGYCLYCYVNLFPDKPISRNYKTKEYSVVEFIKNQFNHLDWVCNKPIIDGCSKKRPDMLLDLGYQVIIIEIDENQHINYDSICDNKRTMELSMDLGHRPLIFIRFNPDSYYKNNIKISSCWGVNKRGLSIVKQFKLNEWTKRLNILEQNIKYWINPINTTNKTINIIQLFYNK